MRPLMRPFMRTAAETEPKTFESDGAFHPHPAPTDPSVHRRGHADQKGPRVPETDLHAPRPSL